MEENPEIELDDVSNSILGWKFPQNLLVKGVCVCVYFNYIKESYTKLNEEKQLYERNKNTLSLQTSGWNLPKN